MKKELSDAEKQDVIDVLNQRIKNLQCPMCQNKGFIIADGYFIHTIQTDLSQLQLGGTHIPTVAIICKHCGFVSFHALGVLGLMPPSQTEKKDKGNE
jgi:hypothetical protein